MTSVRPLRAAAAGGRVALTAAACRSGGSSATVGGVSVKSIVLFGSSRSNAYQAQWQKGARAEAAKLGHKLTTIQSIGQQDMQVQQQLAAGGKPSVYGWWQSVDSAGPRVTVKAYSHWRPGRTGKR